MVAGTVIALTFGIFWGAIQRQTSIFLILRSNAVAQQVVDEIASDLRDPSDFLQTLWDSEKIPHRIAVAKFLSEHCGSKSELSTHTAQLLNAAVDNCDLEVRQDALRLLARLHETNAIPVVVRQLSDPDPEARKMAVKYLAQVGNSSLIPDVAVLLDDSVPDLVELSAKALQQWIAPELESSNERTNVVRVVRAWWLLHKSQNSHRSDSAAKSRNSWVRPHDFSLNDIDSNPSRLSDLKGKTIVLTFWDQSTALSLSNLYILKTVQPYLSNQATIVAISLDPTIHERMCGQEMEAPSKEETKALRSELRHLAKEANFPFKVLIDTSGSVGRNFNAYELPLTVVIDGNGFLSRRFTGARTQKELVEIIESCRKSTRSEP